MANCTVANVLTGVSGDIQSAVRNTTLLTAFVNRAHEQVLRSSNWTFLESSTLWFMTQMDVSDYWIGTGTAQAGTYNTGLNISDLGKIKESSVLDRSNMKPLKRVSAAPLSSSFAHPDSDPTPGRPKQWRNSPDAPYVLSLYPSPDNQNTYQPTPPGAIVGTTVSGALAQRTYFVNLTLVDSAGGESTVGDADVEIVVPAGSLLTVKSPSLHVTKSATGVQYNKYRVYVGTESTDLSLQSTSINIGTDWTEPGTGLVNGTPIPDTSTIEPLGGYVIEFRYIRDRQRIDINSITLQIPDYYEDVMVAGTTAYALRHLRRYDEAREWFAEFRQGIRDMIRDKNIFPKDNSYISPDSATLQRSIAGIESVDQSRFMLP